MMKLNFRAMEAKDIDMLAPYFGLRPNKTCDSVFLESFIWQKYYHVSFAVSEGRAVQWLMELDGEPFSAMPMCREEDLPRYFFEMARYFNEELSLPLRIYLADEEAVRFLKLDPEKYQVTEEEDMKDYLYDGEAMRTLSGKKLHKKKNHVNAFMKEFEGRYEYRKLGCSDRGDVWRFLDLWREQKGEDAEERLDYEVEGIHEILKNCFHINVRMGGIYIDGNLEAFSIGSYNALENMAIIHIEKANPEIRGLYQAINQQFLIHEFADAALVNREDDMGLMGLRQAKQSYNPVGFARKYRVIQRQAGVI